MGGKSDYRIDIFKLTNTRHEYHFIFDDSFFGRFENSLISKGKGDIAIILDKSSTFLTLNFRIKGSVELICDRSGDPFDFLLETEREIIFKYGEIAEELSDTIEIIPWETQGIEASHYIYEFIGLAIPMKKLHPRFADDGEADGIVFTTGDEKKESDNSGNDPRWAELGILKKLKEKENGAS